MSKFRIYALIIGETLPVGKIFGNEIKKMTFAEQKRRKFSPIQGIFSKNKDFEYEKTYATFLPYVDPIKIKSEYVIIHEIEEDKPGSALGGAIKEIDKLCRFLSIAGLEDIKRAFSREHGSFEPYIYQVNKIYELNSKNQEVEVTFKLESGFVYLPKRPEFNKWRGRGTGKFLKEIFNFQDDILQRALKYLYRSSIGHFLLDSGEKIALDHMKSMEIIIKDLSKKRDFKDKLEEAGTKIGLTDKEKEKIMEFWKDRSEYGDIAHASMYDNSERYPNQFPIPTNVEYPGAAFDSIAGSVLLKYFYYKKSLFHIKIEEPFESTEKSGVKTNNEGTFDMIYYSWPENKGISLCFYTNESNEEKLVGLVKKAFAKKYRVNEKDILDIRVAKEKRDLVVILRIKSKI